MNSKRNIFIAGEYISKDTYFKSRGFGMEAGCLSGTKRTKDSVFGIFCMYPRGVDPDRTAGVPYAYKGRLLWREGKRTS